jgi:hypothetical protein
MPKVIALEGRDGSYYTVTKQHHTDNNPEYFQGWSYFTNYGSSTLRTDGDFCHQGQSGTHKLPQKFKIVEIYRLESS